MTSMPTVLYPLTLPALLNHILTSQSSSSPTTLIICSSRETFLLALSRALQDQRPSQDADGVQQLIAPTLHNLLTAGHVNIAFCASVQALLAHLTAYEGSGSGRNPGLDRQKEHGKETLMLVNLLSLHAPTPSFSAQGLSRTFATAVETAVRVGANLVVVEFLGSESQLEHHDEEDEEEGVDVAMRDGEEATLVETEEDPWEQEVSILNVSARKFGSGSGERSWAGRTVKVNRVAGRWFRFQTLKADGG